MTSHGFRGFPDTNFQPPTLLMSITVWLKLAGKAQRIAMVMVDGAVAIAMVMVDGSWWTVADSATHTHTHYRA